ncbi:hypothetical protein [Tengunoibacter tsumagoiensis]|uniref:Uncharacterized protein n=1 Tax=Tengunoibacter tsumagoiensis TaxID=2014871 RepID=A0A402A0H2_9CHLR|nr:hypothetical protein [Tengunoibacter tsumagoiensis]GCE12556.1 hypothetical protein KTT_24150 [Tengunoibacter tsumagoiensis]
MRSISNLPGAIFRLFIFIFGTQAGRITTGVLLIIGGMIYGITSHQIVYRHITGNFKIHVLDDGNDYFEDLNAQTKTYYAVDSANFTPYPEGEILTNGVAVTSLTYVADAHYSINIELANAPSLVGTAYTAVQFTMESQGSAPSSYAFADYSQHPDGYYDNHWWVGGIFAGFGVLFLYAALMIHFIVKMKNANRRDEDDLPLEKIRWKRDPWSRHNVSYKQQPDPGTAFKKYTQ